MEWHVLYIKPNCEKQVTRALARINVAYYSATTLVAIFPYKKGDLFEKPLLPGYLFVKPNQSQCKKLIQINGVINFIFWLDQPVVIRDPEMEQMRGFLNDHNNVNLKKVLPAFGHASKYNVLAIEPVIHTYDKRETVSVAITSLGYILSAEIETAGTRIITARDLSEPDSLHGIYLNTA